MKFAATVVLSVILHSSLANAQCTGSSSVSGTSSAWSVEWQVSGDLINFTVSAVTPGYVAIGFSLDDQMPFSDVVVGAASTQNPSMSFVSDRYVGGSRSNPVTDTSQDITMESAEVVNGRTTIYFTRARDTNDADQDIILPSTGDQEEICFLWAIGDVTLSMQSISFHGSNAAAVNATCSVQFPPAVQCPAVGAMPSVPSSQMPEATSVVSSVVQLETSFIAPSSMAPSSMATASSIAPSPVLETTSQIPNPSPTGMPVVCEGRVASTSFNWMATWTVFSNNYVTFTVSAETTNWVGIGFSLDNIMPNSDIVVGAADPNNPTTYFVSDRYASGRSTPSVDNSQDISRLGVTLVDGVTTISFTRPLITTDRAEDVDLDQQIYILSAIGGNVINYQGNDPNNIERHAQSSVSEMLTLCPNESTEPTESPDSGIVSIASIVFVLAASLLVTLLHL